MKSKHINAFDLVQALRVLIEPETRSAIMEMVAFAEEHEDLNDEQAIAAATLFDVMTDHDPEALDIYFGPEIPEGLSNDQ